VVFRFFRHYIPAHILLLLALEALIMVMSVYLGVSARFLDAGAALPASVEPLMPKAISFSLVMVLIMSALGLYHWEWVNGLWGMALRMAMSFIIGFGVMSLVFYLVPSMFLGRGAFLLSCLLAAGGVGLARLLFFKWLNLDALKRRMLVLGTGSRAAKVEALMKAGVGDKRLHIVGYLPLQGTHHYVEHARVLPDSGSILGIVDKYNIDEIVIAVRDRRSGGLPISELLECKLRGISVIELSTFFEREVGQLQLESLNASWMILSEGFRQGLVRDTVKRVFDLVVSGILLVSALPVMLLTALAIRLESAGPILYRQERVGQHSEIFTIFKFRSMCVDAEADGTPQWADANDSRVTKVGRFIRKLRIDELPQLFNVFMGEMSLVGPRPERAYFVEKLAQEIPYFICRHSVKPGITGWAQVRYQYGASVEDSIEKLQYDLYYVKNHSLFLDLMVIFQTVQVVLWGHGAR
jgi:sugar transferase (PEP-CTERM system associated)